MLNSPPGPVAIIGSGELSDSMAEVHRTLMARLDSVARPVFIDTPAGFEPNVDQIAQKAVAYFKRNFGVDLAVAHYHGSDAPHATVATAVTAIQHANYLFAGPGSPSYAVRMWRDSQVWRAVLARWREGAALVFASAAALTLGRYTIPVYEIYKAGDELRWIDGLDALDWFGSLAVTPHWNNHSGEQHDTRFCFMGAARFAQLETQLPSETLVLGVDEYTGLYIDSVTCAASVLGSGQVTLRHAGRQTVYTKGQTFQLDQARANVDQQGEADGELQTLTPTQDEPEAQEGGETDGDVIALRDSVQRALVAGEFQTAVQGLVTLSLVAGAGLEQGLPGRAERAVQSLQMVLPLLATTVSHLATTDAQRDERQALIELLIANRAELRRAKQFALADGLRDRLAALGYVLEDTPTGTTWRDTRAPNG